jgi:hypothetical protein
MNAPFKMVENLAAHARKEPAPPIDVSYRVISKLRQIETERTAWWPLAFFAGGAAVTASMAFLAGMPLMDLFADPWSACLVSSVGIFI